MTGNMNTSGRFRDGCLRQHVTFVVKSQWHPGGNLSL